MNSKKTKRELLLLNTREEYEKIPEEFRERFRIKLEDGEDEEYPGINVHQPIFINIDAPLTVSGDKPGLEIKNNKVVVWLFGQNYDCVHVTVL